ncbi:MAG: SUMF1/EgtB/PvdO family nonheme iron enzyme, partial [Phycisphaerae bacterium]|nr:SUMF1/EgtB/PvdO family nonheme iron enzyme [Phycisphaerae bacterium]
MRWVPAGTFIKGSDLSRARENERPAHTELLEGFWIDETEVTNDQFAAFV